MRRKRGDSESPLLLPIMDNTRLNTIINEALENKNAFLVDLEIKEGNVITVYADTDNGITIQELKMLNREIESALDRDVEDFALTVSSPGLSNPFKIKRQYKNNIGRWIKVKTTDRETVIGKLEDADDDKITLSIPPEKKKDSARIETLAYEEIVETKIEIRF